MRRQFVVHLYQMKIQTLLHKILISAMLEREKFTQAESEFDSA